MLDSVLAAVGQGFWCVNGLAFDASVHPALKKSTPRVGLGAGAGGSLGLGVQALGDGLHIGQWRRRLKPQTQSQSAKLGEFDMAHEAPACVLTVTVTCTQAD